MAQRTLVIAQGLKLVLGEVADFQVLALAPISGDRGQHAGERLD